MLVDTHCHIHESYELPVNEVMSRAHDAGVQQMICVGTSEESSRQAIEFANLHSKVYAAVGVHPHETKDGYLQIASLVKLGERTVAIGEIGLDYFYTHSPREVQIEALKVQVEVAIKHNLPIIFHVREAFDDFWPIFEALEKMHGPIRGVLHSFTDSKENMEKAITKGLYIGVNGISTFTKDEAQKAMFDAVPLDHLLFETDAPFLTPTPYRGKINEPAYVEVIAAYHAARRGISLKEIADATTHNARALFQLK
ncbi:MAG TPA: TatD family hydrolase [Dongiaceae bacterium]|nr:TatD family hydrolase [Dongiaceae bacterium]